MFAAEAVIVVVVVGLIAAGVGRSGGEGVVVDVANAAAVLAASGLVFAVACVAILTVFFAVDYHYKYE